MSKERELGAVILDELLTEHENKIKEEKGILKLAKLAAGARWRKIKKGYLKFRKEVYEEQGR